MDMVIFFAVIGALMIGAVFWMGEHVEHKDDQSKK